MKKRFADAAAAHGQGVTQTCHILAVTCSLMLATFASPAWSQSGTGLSEQIWIDVNPSYYFDPHKKLYASLGVRRELEDDGWWRLVIQPGYRTKATQRLFFSAGLENLFTFNPSSANQWELRPVQSLDLAWPRGQLPLRHRLRLEERFDFNTETWSTKISLRLRYKLNAAYRFAAVQEHRFWQVTAAGEAFFTITGTEGQFQERSRLTLGVDRSLDLDIHFRFELTWQYESPLFDDGDDTGSSLYFRFRLMKSWGESAGLRKETSS
jgi:hypothetical protein